VFFASFEGEKTKKRASTNNRVNEISQFTESRPKGVGKPIAEPEQKAIHVTGKKRGMEKRKREQEKHPTPNFSL